MFGAWTTNAATYAQSVRRIADEIGLLDFAAPQDWMCEPDMLRRTGLSVQQHQDLTLKNFLELRTLDAELPFIPVLQGWSVDDYLRHADAYERAGIELAEEPRVGVGSVCRRQHTGEIESLIERLRAPGLKLHAFGVKTQGLGAYGGLLASGDSLAWSFAARNSPPLDGHASRHGTCQNCFDFALQWREQMLDKLDLRQERLHVSFVVAEDEEMRYSATDTRVSGKLSTSPIARSSPTPVTSQTAGARNTGRRLTSTFFGAAIKTDTTVFTVYAEADGTFLGEISQDARGQYRPVPLIGRKQTRQTFDTLKQAGETVGWKLPAHTSLPVINADWEAERRYCLTFVRWPNGKVRFGAYDPETQMISPETHATTSNAGDSNARGASNDQGDARMATPSGALATVNVFVNDQGGFWFDTTATGITITGSRFVGDVLVEADTPEPTFVQEARTTLKRNQLNLTLW